MATKFSPCKGSYVLNQFPSNVMFGMNGFHLSASGAIQGHHGPLVYVPRLLLLLNHRRVVPLGTNRASHDHLLVSSFQLKWRIEMWSQSI